MNTIVTLTGTTKVVCPTCQDCLIITSKGKPDKYTLLCEQWVYQQALHY